MDWQPIETAPKDGTKVLLHFAGWFWLTQQKTRHKFTAISVGWFQHVGYDTEVGGIEGFIGDAACIGCDDVAQGRVKATHWMPLPEPPKD